MPIIGNLFVLTENLSPVYEDGDYLTFYIGSFLGGPIYLKNRDPSIYSFSVTISGAVRYNHYVLGYTSPEEYEDNKKSSSPYFDLEVWQNGILHSGPKSYVSNNDYKDCYDAAIYWQKVTSVSYQTPESWVPKVSVNMMYEPFVAAGAAVAFGGRATTNCPLSWLTFTTSYKDCLQDSSCDTWGPHHEYHHHFQSNYGISKKDVYDDGETSNNAVTLISYSLFSKVSQRRSENSEPTCDGWNTYSSASWTLNDVINTNHSDYHLSMFSVFLHNFGQDMLIEAMNKEKGNSLNLWFSAWTNLTELDLSYFFQNIYNTLVFKVDQSEIDKYKNMNFKKFIPKKVTNIENGTFASCESLSSIIIPENVISISNFSFYSCISLHSVIIPDSVTIIGNMSFENCTSLKSVTLSKNIKVISALAFSNCQSLFSIIIPKGVTLINDLAFIGCKSLKSVIIPNSVKIIGNLAFLDCISLPSIIIPEGVISIGNYAFRSCSSLTSISFPDTLISIGDNAFTFCHSLTSVYISKSVKKIASDAFIYCDKLKRIDVSPENEVYKSVNGWLYDKKDNRRICCQTPRWRYQEQQNDEI